jgi:hypothetical protein
MCSNVSVLILSEYHLLIAISHILKCSFGCIGLFNTGPDAFASQNPVKFVEFWMAMTEGTTAEAV